MPNFSNFLLIFPVQEKKLIINTIFITPDYYYKIYLFMSVTFSTDDYAIPDWSGEPKYSS